MSAVGIQGVWNAVTLSAVVVFMLTVFGSRIRDKTVRTSRPA